MRIRSFAGVSAIILALCFSGSVWAQDPQQAPADSSKPAAAAVAPPEKLVLREGADVSLKFAQDLSSKTANDDDPVALVLDQDLKIGDVLVVKAGAKAVGTITHAKKAGMMGKAGELNMRLDYLITDSGRLRLRGTKGKEGEGKVGATVALTVLFGPIGSINALDVTDLVSGGDGSTHRRGNAIDALTGEAGVLGVVDAREGDHKYHQVPLLAVVDGCFVPDGSRGSMQVDSRGDRFPFPATSNLSFNRIWTGGVIPWNTPRGISSVLHNVDYSTPEHAILCVHSNNGLTLDLAAIRRLYPNRKITAFDCLVGNSYVNGSSDETGVNPRADVYAIVDGASRFEKRGFTNQNGTFKVDVSLNDNDRFLTLATTDGGDGINDDWVLWVDAVLRLSP